MESTARSPLRARTVDIVVPVFDEVECVEGFHHRLALTISSLPYQVMVRYVDDGSTDGTNEVLERIARSDHGVEVVRLSRNFGHQAALTAGLDHADADAVVTMDGDGQHPPELLPELLKLFETGYDIVLTQRRDQRTGFFKRWTSAAFYRILNLIAETRLVPGSADFRLMSRQVVEAMCAMPEYHRFLRGMIAWAGYRTVILPFEPGVRLGGQAKYRFRKMVRLAMDATFSFSLVPLYLGVALGIFFLTLALAEVVYVSSLWLGGERGSLAPGWSSLMFMLLIVGATLSTILGIIGVYVGYIFQEVKRRPLYLVRSRDALRREVRPPGDSPQAPMLERRIGGPDDGFRE